MPPEVLRKNCTHCGKVFLTHDEEMEFCNSTCKHRQKYNEHFGLRQPKRISVSCTFCGEEIRTVPRRQGKEENRFCNSQCRRGYDKRQRDAESNSKEKKSRTDHIKKIPYEVLEKMEEKKRVFDDRHAYWYTRRGGSY